MAAMKLRHAAALALVGWYLLYPPWNAEKATLDPGTALIQPPGKDDGRTM